VPENGPRQQRSRRLPREVRERQILDAAVEVFSTHGYHAASMDEIAETAGVSKPMVYTYLGAKEDLFATCIRREAQRLLESIEGGVGSDLPPDMQLWSGLKSFFTFVGKNRSSWTVLHRQALSVGGSFAREVTQMRSRAITLVAALVVASGTKEGVGARAEKSGEGMAAALVGATESLADWWLDHPDVSDEVLASWLMNLVWLGFGDLVKGEAWVPADDALGS
jgi:AcrR family transcriptional regulator